MKPFLLISFSFFCCLYSEAQVNKNLSLHSSSGEIYPSRDSLGRIISAYAERSQNAMSQNTRYFLYRENQISMKLKSYYFFDNPQDVYNKRWKSDSIYINRKLLAYRRNHKIEPLRDIHNPEQPGKIDYPIKSSSGEFLPTKDSLNRILDLFQDRYGNELNRNTKYFLFKENLTSDVIRRYYFYDDPQSVYNKRWKKDSIAIENRLSRYRRDYAIRPDADNSVSIQRQRPVKSPKDSILPSDLYSITISEVLLANFQLNYEKILINKNSIEVQLGLKAPFGGEKIPRINLGIVGPIAFQYLAASGFSGNISSKFNISKKHFRSYFSMGAYYRYWWYNHKLLDLSLDGTNHNDHLYWQSATHQMGGFNVVLGRQVFYKGGVFIDMFIGAGARINFIHETLFQEYDQGLWTYNPPKVYFYTEIQPTFQIGIKIGLYDGKVKSSSLP
jgi:hypothetical protein